MPHSFCENLRASREQAQLTNCELAKLAKVPASLLSGLQRGTRRVGERNARQIGEALGLIGTDLEKFVLAGMDTCTEKVLKVHQGYPAVLINFLPTHLLQAGVEPDLIRDYAVVGNQMRVTLLLSDGRRADIETRLIVT